MIRAARSFLVFLLVTAVGTCPDARGQDVAAIEAVEEGRAARQRYMDRIGQLRLEIERHTARPLPVRPGNGEEEVPRMEQIVALGRLYALVGQFDHAIDLLLNEVTEADSTTDLEAVRELLGKLVLLPVALVSITVGVIVREESYLERKFGAEYISYKSTVRRWL